MSPVLTWPVYWPELSPVTWWRWWKRGVTGSQWWRAAPTTGGGWRPWHPTAVTVSIGGPRPTFIDDGPDGLTGSSTLRANWPGQRCDDLMTGRGGGYCWWLTFDSDPGVTGGDQRSWWPRWLPGDWNPDQTERCWRWWYYSIPTWWPHRWYCCCIPWPSRMKFPTYNSVPVTVTFPEPPPPVVWLVILTPAHIPDDVLTTWHIQAPHGPTHILLLLVYLMKKTIPLAMGVVVGNGRLMAKNMLGWWWPQWWRDVPWLISDCWLIQRKAIYLWSVMLVAMMTVVASDPAEATDR